MGTSVLDINDLSPHLFWDFDKHLIKSVENREFIVQRVLEYGLLNWLGAKFITITDLMKSPQLHWSSVISMAGHSLLYPL